MNERIKDLSLKAAYAVDLADPKFLEKYSKKFAELIVRECIQVAIEQKQWVEKQQPTFNYDDDKWDRARIQQSQHIADKIKEHFGVEE